MDIHAASRSGGGRRFEVNVDGGTQTDVVMIERG